ncbi:hypothetical protein CYMTET_55501 [Cymbomonas tetramitiformis]|uniref:6-phosphogluconolactonase n=1 Tax=Cymbomonas tetramitiformis TaxID=36881 RepID=A0AAE0BCW5_9CHLO|nr:hypothetical protein CYMTET_55501 [Cymbomonas tetramitiformis]
MGGGGDGSADSPGQEARCKTGYRTASAGSTFLVSTYTDNAVLAHCPKGQEGQGIYTLHLDDCTGRITKVATSELGPNPAFLIRHPTLPNIVYASTERISSEGEVVALELEHSGALTVLGKQSAGGKSTCYINITPDLQSMLVVNYWDAKLSVLPLDNAGRLGCSTNTYMQPDAKYVEDNQPTREEHWKHRQRWPHSHCAVTEPYTQAYTFVTDLGQDKVFCYKVLHCGEENFNPTAEIQLPKGKGPRHLVFHPTVNCAYVVNELDSTVTVLSVNLEGLRDMASDDCLCHTSLQEGAVLSEMQTLSTLPETFENSMAINEHGVWKAKSHSSEIRVHPAGLLLLVGNRGHDSIAVFSIDTARGGGLHLLQCHPSGGKTPRNFNFDNSGRFLVVGNQDSNNLTVYELDPIAGIQTQTDQIALPSPNYVYAVPV